MDLLAVNDGVVIGQWVFNAVVTVALAYIGAKNRQVEKLQDEVKASAKLEIKLQLEPLRQTIDGIARRLADGEQLFGRMGERDHQTELKLINLLSEVKEKVRECYVTRDDFGRWEAHVNSRFDGLQQLLARAVEERRHG